MLQRSHILGALALIDALEAAGSAPCWIEADDTLEIDVALLAPELTAQVDSWTGGELPDVARPGYPHRRALRLVLRAQGRAAREALACPVWALRGLPCPLTLRLERVPPQYGVVPHEASARPFVVTTVRAEYEQAVAAGHPAFVLRELETAALAVELERCRPRDVDQWLDTKLRAPRWTLSAGEAGVLDVRDRDDAAQSTLCLGTVIDAIGATLLSVDF